MSDTPEQQAEQYAGSRYGRFTAQWELCKAAFLAGRRDADAGIAALKAALNDSCEERRSFLMQELGMPCPADRVNVPMKRMSLPPAVLADAKRLMGFDYGDALYHVLLFDFGDDGGALGIWRDGDDFCARITLDALAEFNANAKHHETPNG